MNSTSTRLSLDFTEREVAMIVASLRLWQYEAETSDLEDAFIGHFKRHRPLTDEEINAFCPRFRFDESQGKLTGQPDPATHDGS
jgi:hypothetical protein